MELNKKIKEVVRNVWEWFKKNSIAFVIGVAGIILFLFTGKEVLHHGESADRARENAERAKENARRAREENQRARESAERIRQDNQRAREDNQRIEQILETIRNEQQIKSD
jgi:hypothetical protein